MLGQAEFGAPLILATTDRNKKLWLFVIIFCPEPDIGFGGISVSEQQKAMLSQALGVAGFSLVVLQVPGGSIRLLSGREVSGFLYEATRVNLERLARLDHTLALILVTAARYHRVFDDDDSEAQQLAEYGFLRPDNSGNLVLPESVAHIIVALTRPEIHR